MAFEFIFTTEEIRKKIFNFLKENDKLFEYNDINWQYGVYDRDSGIFMALVDYTLGLGRCCNEYIYIVLTDKGEIFEVSSEDDCYNFEIPAEYAVLSDKVKEGINFYCVYDFIDDFFDIVKEKSEELDRISKIMNEKLRIKRDLMLNKYNS